MMEAAKHSSPFLKERLANMDPLLVKIVSTRMRLAARIDDLMKDRGWTSLDVANKLGTTKDHVTHILSAECTLDIEGLVQIAHAFEIEVRDLFPEVSYFETKDGTR